MNSPRLSGDAQGYLESLMRTGQDAMKQFDDALVSAAGVGTKDHRTSGSQFFPFALFVDLQREYFTQLWRFWNSVFLQNFAGGCIRILRWLVATSASRMKSGGKCRTTIF